MLPEVARVFQIGLSCYSRPVVTWSRAAEREEEEEILGGSKINQQKCEK